MSEHKQNPKIIKLLTWIAMRERKVWDYLFPTYSFPSEDKDPSAAKAMSLLRDSANQSARVNDQISGKPEP